MTQEAQHSVQGGREDAVDSTVKEGTKQAASRFKILQEQGICAGYSSTSITISFEPTSVIESEEDVEIVCSVKQKGPVRPAPEVFRVHLQVQSIALSQVGAA